MSFPAEWLRLREPLDHAARSAELAGGFAAALPGRAVDLLDLGCGLGSNLRWLAPRLERPQRWVLVDHDPALLAAVPDEIARWAHARGLAMRARGAGWQVGDTLEVETVAIDLRDPGGWPDADGVVTQALLDLCDEGWLADLAGRLAGRPLLAALTVDGRVAWTPADPDDDRVQAAFRAHQTAGKPGIWAGPWLAGRLSALGYTARLAEADWRIGAEHAAMLQAMVDGTRQAAAEVLGDEAVAAWYGRRSAATGRPTGLVVGHVDLLAVSRAARG